MQLAGNIAPQNGQRFVLGRRGIHTNFDDGHHDESAENPFWTEQAGKLGPSLHQSLLQPVPSQQRTRCPSCCGHRPQQIRDQGWQRRRQRRPQAGRRASACRRQRRTERQHRELDASRTGCESPASRSPAPLLRTSRLASHRRSSAWACWKPSPKPPSRRTQIPTTPMATASPAACGW